MARQSMVGVSALLAACVAFLSGCQNSPPRRTTTPAFTQKSGPMQTQMAGGQGLQNAAPMNSPSGLSTANNMGPGLGSAPNTNPGGTGSNFRTTQPFIPTSGPGPASPPSSPSFGAPTPPAPPPPPSSSNFGSNFNPPAAPMNQAPNPFTMPGTPIAPPANPALRPGN